MGIKTKSQRRLIRHRRVRKKIKGVPERPRVCVFRSLRHISGQVVDDTSGKTLCSVTTAGGEIKEQLKKTSNVESAEQFGKILGEKMKEAGIQEAVFDRGGFLYHGRVKAFVEGIRETGIKI